MVANNIKLKLNANNFRVNKKMEEDPNGCHDFLTLVGLVSYYGSGEDD